MDGARRTTAHNACSSASSTNVVSIDDETRPHDVSGKHINDEHHIDEALPCADVSKISPPQLVRTFCHELTVYAVACGDGFPADGSADLFILPRRTPASPITVMR